MMIHMESAFKYCVSTESGDKHVVQAWIASMHI